MPTINTTLLLAKRALLANQGAMGMCSDNVANVNTPGYARKRALMASVPGLDTSLGYFGGGVTLLGITGERDVFVEHQVHQAMSQMGQHNTSYQRLQMIEDVIGDMGETGLASALDRFWNGWHDLSNDPSSLSARNALRESARNLTYKFHNIDERLRDHTASINSEIETIIERVNIITHELAKLNRNMVQSGNLSPHLVDRRTVLLDELCELTGAEYKINDDQTSTIFLDGVSLLMGSNAQTIGIEKDATGNVNLVIPSANNRDININSGKIGALLEVRDVDLHDLRASLDEFAVTLAKEVNGIHVGGYNLDGATGIHFFNSKTTGMRDFSISDEIVADANNIAISADGNTGDNQIALLIAGLENSAVLSNGSETFGQAFANITSQIGSRVQNAEINAEGARLALNQAEAWRESVSGVSLDEEMANLIRYQLSFNASAKLIGMVESMLETVLGLVR